MPRCRRIGSIAALGIAVVLGLVAAGWSVPSGAEPSVLGGVPGGVPSTGAATPGSRAPGRDTIVAPAPAGADSAVLRFYNRRIFVYRGSLGAASPSERAAHAERRISALVESNPRDRVVTRRIPEGILVSVGDHGVFTVTPADVDTLLGESLESVAEEAAGHLQEAFLAASEQRNLGRIARAAGAALLGTLVFVLAIRLLIALHRFIMRRLVASHDAARQRLRVGDFQLLDVARAQVFAARTFGLLLWVLALVLLDIWITFALTRFPYTAPWGHALGHWFLETIQGLVGKALRAVPGMLTVVAIFVFTRWLVRRVSLFFGAVQRGRVTVPWLHVETALPTQRITVTLLWLFAVMIAYPYVPGSGSGIFKGISLFAGLVVSLGSSAFVGQAMSGFVLMYSRFYRPGDYVRIGEVEGTIVDLGMLSTKVETPKHEIVAIPNAVVVNQSAKNYSRLQREGGSLLLYTTVTIGYDASWRLVHAMLEEAARRTPGLGRESRPFVQQSALSDFYVEYQLNAVLEAPCDRIQVLADLHSNIQDLFNENGVQIMSPHFEWQPQRKVWSPPEEWHTPLARRPEARSAPGPSGAE